MKTVITLLVMAILLPYLTAQRATAQSFELEQLILNVTKLEQLRNILDKMKDGYEQLSKGYKTVRDLSKGNFDIHKVFLDKMLEVSPTVSGYYRVYEVMRKQKSILSEYGEALASFRDMQVFSTRELSYIESVYKGLVKRSGKELDDLLMIITSGQLRMNEADRLKRIDRIDANLTDQLNFLRYFNSNTNTLAAQKYRARQDMATLRSIYR